MENTKNRKISWVQRLTWWLDDGPSLSLRRFFFYYILLFGVTTLILASIAFLARENRHRIGEIRAAVIVACRDSNDVRSAGRQILQILKNEPPPHLGTFQVFRRYDALTRGQALLVDERCIPLRTNIHQTR